MPCGHRFCRDCVASMRRHGAAVAQVCPLCRGAMPDAERLRMDASHIITQHERWKKGKPDGAPLPAAAQKLVARAASREALAIDPSDACAHCNLGYALEAGGLPAGAEAAFRGAATAADPQLAAVAHCNLGFILERRGDKAGAEAAYRAAAAANPRDLQFATMAHYKPGVVLERNRDKAGAGAAYRAAIAADPQHAGSHYN